MSTNTPARSRSLSACGGLFWLATTLAATTVAAQETPKPELRVLSYEGDLCPAGSLKFPVSDGGLTVRSTVAAGSDQTCHIAAELVVPAGYRVHASIFSGKAFDMSNVSAPYSQVTFSYALCQDGSKLADCKQGSPSYVSGETFPKIIEQVRNTQAPHDAGVEHPLEIDVPECTDPTQPMLLPLSVDITTNVPANTMLRIFALSGAFLTDTEWSTCDGTAGGESPAPMSKH